MSQTIQLNATKRTELGRGATIKLRSQMKIPAVLYGHGVDPVSITLDAVPFKKAFAAAGESSLLDVVIDGTTAVKAIIHDIQQDPLGTDVHHVDFYQVNMAEKIKAEVELVFEGIPPAVKELGGILVKNLSHLQIECLPGNLPHHIVVNIDALKTFDDSIRVSDIPAPEGVTILNSLEDSVVLVTAPRSEEELASLNEAVVEDVASVEVAKPEKAEADEPETPPAASNK